MLVWSLVTLVLYAQLTAPQVVVTVQGIIQGISMDGYISYIGIPYASVNDGVARFKRAGPAPVWHGVRESKDPRCSKTSEAQECLQLDVNVPASGRSMPVFVWVKGSGGQFNTGSIVKQGVIVVSVRHRLGPLGFLCSHKHKIPGNAGLKDIIQALRWIQDNIIAFNGNPHNVVLGGQGFGSAMVEALILSPSTKGLFHGAILQSGSVLAPWALNFDSEERALLLSMKFNSSNELTKIPTAELANKAGEIEVAYFPFGMCVEVPFRNEERVLFEYPFQILLNTNTASVPLIIGYNNNEAYIFARTIKAFNTVKRAKTDMSTLLPAELKVDVSDLPDVMDEIHDIYFRDNITVDSVLNYYRDLYFLAHIYKSARLHAREAPVYFYQFSYTTHLGVQPELNTIKRGAAHSDELAYLFSDEMDMSDEDKFIKRNILELWTNFIKYLNPNHVKSVGATWEAVNPNHVRLLDISGDIEMVDFPFAKEAGVWEDIYEKYYYLRG